ncbi:S8 family serine peptidase [Deinococcus multiflagellatus]|uniref:S8 family serine peptidase n=1 Tax=Deinococcus multiflagellatus TaxID=1656887 RepID=A0ABW1ZSU1_9DEIO|nr:S8 family serine peptidase [Deinococcus multiflagellatus]MBZ9713625.1 S8 family serine peptidase [Deinococcus multiflagellatus]
MRRTFPCILLTALLLPGCSRLVTPEVQRPTTTVTVPVTASVTNEALERQYGGRVALRTETFAVVGNPTRAPLQGQGAGPQPQANQNVLSVPSDTPPTFWSSASKLSWGRSTGDLWSSTVTDWTATAQQLWSGGTYQGLPANTGAWRRIGLDNAYANSRLGAGQVIAVVDSGLDLQHPMFTHLLSDPSTWHDFVDGDARPQDEGTAGEGAYGHGTVVAGIAAQVAPRAKIMPLRVLDHAGRGDALNVAAAIVWAVDHGADVINLSLGTAEPFDALQQAIAYANRQQVLVVAAAGNSDRPELDHPAADFAGQALSVAVGSVDSDDLKSSFSSYGSAVGLMAPGEQVAAPYPGARAGQFSGTSMSTPVVAGALALGLSEGASPEGAREALQRAARRVDLLPGNSAYQGQLGAGRVNLTDFLDDLDD